MFKEIGLASVIATNSWITESPGKLFQKIQIPGSYPQKHSIRGFRARPRTCTLKKQINKNWKGFFFPWKVFFLSEDREISYKFIGRQPGKGLMTSEQVSPD